MARAIWPSEDQIQSAIVKECRLRGGDLSLILHIPNEGKRSVIMGSLLKKLGLLPGVADLFLPVARTGWHGLWLELKSHGKKPTSVQAAFLDRMQSEGYATYWCDNVSDAMLTILRYHTGKWPRPNWVHYGAEVKA
jgi:hypothetical protein